MKRPTRSPVRWSLSVASFLLGLMGVLWWQQRQDEQLLRQMDD